MMVLTFFRVATNTAIGHAEVMDFSSNLCGNNRHKEALMALID